MSVTIGWDFWIGLLLLVAQIPLAYWFGYQEGRIAQINREIAWLKDRKRDAA